ncbi:MAG: YlbF family regulator [Clostridia bacterium]|nr:YlbF family regulator [Lachnospiraceae bacterium]NCC01598.1 YlbF family regulator [Clostridia bacterium]NCD02333.1 YlbF family regulator [Clostridia bacterium]
MRNVEYQTRQLIRTIKQTNVYNQYRRLQIKIQKDETLSRRVNEFRKACFAIQNKPEEPEDMDRLEALNMEYGDILDNSDVREFLTAEQGLAQMMNQVTDRMYDSLDIDVSFLEN